MEITFSTGSLTGLSLSTIFKIARGLPVDGVELMLTARLLKQGPQRVQELEQSTGVAVRSVHTVLRVTCPSAEQAAADIVESARFARNLMNCATLVVHTPDSHAMHTVETRAWLTAIDSVLEMTEGTPLRIAVENSGRLSNADPTSYFDHPERLRWVAQEWGVGLTFDTAHAASRQWDLLSAARRLMPHLLNVHLSDYGRRSYPFALANAFIRDHRLPGTGALPLRELLGQLSARDYSGLVTLELSPLALRVPWRPASERRLREAIDFCRAASNVRHSLPQQSRHQQRP